MRLYTSLCCLIFILGCFVFTLSFVESSAKADKPFQLASTTAIKNDKPLIHGPLKVDIINVIDGDTIDIRATIWLDQTIQTRVRLDGIDTPEIKGKCTMESEMALKAKEYLQDLLRRNDLVLTNVHYGKYAGRVVASLYTINGDSIAESLIAEGFARPYNGGKRQPWCQKTAMK